MSSLSDGFAGLFLSIANWLSPMEGNGELQFNSMLLADSVLVIECEQKFRWSDDATAIIDAGIPLMVTFYTSFNEEKVERYTRILRSKIDEDYYTVVDSVSKELYDKREFSNIYLAVKAFQRVEFTFPSNSKEIEILGILLPSPVSSLGKTISLAPICGGERFHQKIILDRKK